MNSLRTFLCITLVCAISTESLVALADDNLRGPQSVSEASAEQDLARAMGFQETTPPAEILTLRNELVGNFFEGSLSRNEDPTTEEKGRLISALQKLKAYFTSEDRSGQFDNLIPETVAPFVQNLTQEELLRSKRAGLLTNPIAKWTLESLLVKSMVSAFSKSIDLPKRATQWVRKDLRGASVKAAVLLGLVAFFAGDHFLLNSYFFSSLENSLLWGFRMQFGQTICAAMIGWLLSPPQEVLKMWMNRIFGKLQGWFSGLLSKAKPKQREGDERQADANIAPRIADLAKHGTNFGGQSATDQVKNLDHFMPIFAAHPTRASQLWQDSVAAGKGAMIGALWDLSNSAAFLYNMDSNLAIQAVRIGQILNRNITILAADTNLDITTKRANIEYLGELFEKYEALCTATWAEDLDENQQQQIKLEFAQVKKEMRELGVSERDLNQLWDLQVGRAKAVSAFVTGINFTLFRRRMNAENNLNGFPEFAAFEGAHYRGFNIEDFVSRYQKLVQDQQINLKMENSRVPVPPCESFLEKVIGNAPVAN